MRPIAILLCLLSLSAWASDPKTEAGTGCLDCSTKQQTPILPVTPNYPDSDFGTCAEKANQDLVANPWYKIFSPKKPYQQLQDAWQSYNQNMNIRVKANSQVLDDELHFSKSPVVFLAMIERLNPVMKSLDKLNEDGVLDKLKQYPAFKASVGTNYFMAAIRDFNFSDPQSDLVKDLDLANSPDALASMKVIQDTLKDPSNFRVMQIMVRNNLSLIDNNSRKNAEDLKAYMNSHGVDYARIESWKDNPPLMKDVAYPTTLTGPFADLYKKYVQADVSDFLMNHTLKIGDTSEQKNDPEVAKDLAALRKALPGITYNGMKSVNEATTPTNGEKVAYDDWIHPLHRKDNPSLVAVNGKSIAATPAQLEAIDAVARTIWGEGQGCAAQGLPQFEAIGRVICERAQDVKNSLVEKKKVDAQNEKAVSDFNTSLFGKDSESKQVLLSKLSSTRLQGYADFGRTDKPGAANIDPNIQVISRPMQFSIWNSSRYENLSLSEVNPNHSANIPNTNLMIQKPQGAGDDSALLNVVCPAKTQFPKLWQHALDLAKQIVLTPSDYLKNYRFDTKEKNILFYTHAMGLPFAKEVKVDNFIMPPAGKPVSLRENPPGKVVAGSCGQFRLFVPNNGGTY